MRRRWLLLPLLCGAALVFPLFRNYYYISAISTLSIFIILSVFPYLTEIFHTQPLFVEDLDNPLGPDVDPVTEMEFRRMFVVIMRISLAIAVCGIINYAVFDVQSHHFSLTLLIGTIGGCGVFYYKVQTLLGKGLLKLIMWRKRSLHHKSQKTLLEGPKSEETVPVGQEGGVVPELE